MTAPGDTPPGICQVSAGACNKNDNMQGSRQLCRMDAKRKPFTFIYPHFLYSCAFIFNMHSHVLCVHNHSLVLPCSFFCTRIFERTGRLPKTIPDSSGSTVCNIMFFLKVFMKFMCFSCVVHATIFPMFGASSLVKLSKQRMWTLWAQENLGSVGFQGRDGIFVFKSLVRDADRAFMALDYYKTYTVNRSVELHNYFATIAEIPQNGTCPGRPSRRSRGV